MELLLADHGFGEHTAQFKSERVTLDTLPALGDADLRELGVALMGPRKRMLALFGDAAKLAAAAARPAKVEGGGGGARAKPAAASNRSSTAGQRKPLKQKVQTHLRRDAHSTKSQGGAKVPLPAQAPEAGLTLELQNQGGEIVSFGVTPTTRMDTVFKAYAVRKGIDDGEERDLVYIFDGVRILRHDTPKSLDMEDGDRIAVLVNQRGSIGPWEAPAAAIGSGSKYLCGGAPLPPRHAAAAILHALRAPASPTPLVAFPRATLLDATQRAALMRHADGARRKGQQRDLKLLLTPQALSKLVGAVAVQALLARFGSGTVDEIKLRRVETDGGRRVINFHLDADRKTMQVALNGEGGGEGEYEGGALVYVTGDGFEQPRRPAGSATIHDDTIVHGVTQLVSGVRYGLFLLQKKGAGRGGIGIR